MENVVIFGASGGAVKVAETFRSFGLDFLCFVDNDRKKWDTEVCGKRVMPPAFLKESACSVIIASIYQEEIEKQLFDMGIDRERIVPKEKYILECINVNLDEYKKCVENAGENSSRTFFIDLAEGTEIGGIESWSFNLAELFEKEGEDSFILTNKASTAAAFSENLQRRIIRCDMSYEFYKESVQEVLAYMARRMPCVVIANWMTQVYYAGYILQKFYPDKVKIIAGLHHDMLGYYKRSRFLEDYVDLFVCVSSVQYQRMTEEFGISSDRVVYQPVPVQVTEQVGKKVRNNEIPIVISFGARLVKAQKRADYIIDLIEGLEQENVNYCFQIAGEGPYGEIIQRYITDKNIESKVKLFGKVSYDKMKAFWQKADIVVSVSDSEGMGLSVLEAMSCGAVPIVTDTAGIREFVHSGKNGYVVGLGDIGRMVQRISYLDVNREELVKMKELSQAIIREKCNAHEYYKLFSVYG